MKEFLKSAFLFTAMCIPIYGSEQLRVIRNSDDGVIEEKLVFEDGRGIITIDKRTENTKKHIFSGMDLKMKIILAEVRKNQCVITYKKNSHTYLASLLFEGGRWKLVFSERIFIDSSDSLKVIETKNQEICLTGSVSGEIIFDSVTGLPKLKLGGKERDFPTADKLDSPVENVITGGLRRAGNKK